MSDGTFLDETFTSYIYRMVALEHVPDLSVHELLFLYSIHLRNIGSDPDCNPECDFVRALEKSLPKDACAPYLFYNVQDWIIPRFYRKSYCYECFRDQISSFSHPAILRSWGIPSYTTCHIHNRMLLDGEIGSGKSLDSSIQLFKYHHDVRKARVCDALHPESDRISRDVHEYLLRMKDLTLTHDSSAARNLIYFCELFFGLMLLPNSGLCSRLFNNSKKLPVDTSLWKRLRLGPFIASITQRQLASLLLALVLDISQIGRSFDSASYALNGYFEFSTLKELGRAANVLAEVAAMEVGQLLKQYASRSNNKGAIEFVHGYLSKQ